MPFTDKIDIVDAYVGCPYLLYVPMKTDIAEKSWNSTITNTNVTLTTVWGITCWYFNWSARLDSNLPSFPDKNHTISFWYKDNWSYDSTPIISSNTSWVTTGECFRYSSSSNLQYVVFSSSSNITNVSWLTKTNWNYIVYSWWNVYVNWVLKSSTWWTYLTWYNFTLWWHSLWGSWLKYVTWYMSDVIIDGEVRDATKISNYYNNSKSYYGL